MGCGDGITGRPAGQRLLMDDRGGGVRSARARGDGRCGGGVSAAGYAGKDGEHGRPPAAFRCLINYPRNARSPQPPRRLPVQISRYLLYRAPGLGFSYNITAIFLIFTLPRVHCLLLEASTYYTTAAAAAAARRTARKTPRYLLRDLRCH